VSTDTGLEGGVFVEGTADAPVGGQSDGGVGHRRLEVEQPTAALLDDLGQDLPRRWGRGMKGL
jgi:hypothetical protein